MLRVLSDKILKLMPKLMTLTLTFEGAGTGHKLSFPVRLIITHDFIGQKTVIIRRSQNFGKIVEK